MADHPASGVDLERLWKRAIGLANSLGGEDEETINALLDRVAELDRNLQSHMRVNTTQSRLIADICNALKIPLNGDDDEPDIVCRVQSIRAELVALLDRVAELEKGLRFYSEAERWFSVVANVGNAPHRRVVELLQDRGEHARRLLPTTKEQVT